MVALIPASPMEVHVHHQHQKAGSEDREERRAATSPSPSSSPAHDFSFTISLHSAPERAKSASSFAIDLSPADDIFFHGHLLPLHLLSHLPVSPRSSTNSVDGFTLPIRELLLDERRRPEKTAAVANGDNDARRNNPNAPKPPKPFSLFRWRKGREVRGREDKEKRKTKLSFDVGRVLKRYARMVRPLLFFVGKRDDVQIPRQPLSFSGNLRSRNKREVRKRRGECSSAPASIRTSPTNSGLLVAAAALPSSTSDSTMEELQAAIQAAIAHCKNSVAAEEKLNR